jgi:hypothetical protein
VRAHSSSGRNGSISGTVGNRCDTTGVSDNSVNVCRSRSRVDDCIDVTPSAAGRVAIGVKFSATRLAGRGEAFSTGSIAEGFSDDVVTVVLETAGHALACEGVGGIVTLTLVTTMTCCGTGIEDKTRRPKVELAANNKVTVREGEKRACGRGIEECTCRSAGDVMKPGSVVRGSE